MDHVLELHADGCRLWEGGYSRYAAERRAVPAEAPPPTPRSGGDSAQAESRTAEKEERRFSYEEQRQRKRDEEKLRRRLHDAEAEVGRLDALRQEILMEMEDPGLATEAARLADLQSRLEATQREASAAISEWERLAVRLDAFLDGAN
jgi:ATP-binding cassette subfamily F protein 3